MVATIDRIATIFPVAFDFKRKATRKVTTFHDFAINIELLLRFELME